MDKIIMDLAQKVLGVRAESGARTGIWNWSSGSTTLLQAVVVSDTKIAFAKRNLFFVF